MASETQVAAGGNERLPAAALIGQAGGNERAVNGPGRERFDSLADDDPIPCSHCGETATIELHQESGRGGEFSVTVCARCGADD